jgi:hypothetical protein
MIAANAAVGANNHKLVFNDCAVQPTSTTTTTTASSGSGDNCTTVAQVGANKTLTVTLTDATGAPINNQTVDFAFTVDPGTASANFPLAQPPGGSQTTTNGSTAACTTGAAGNAAGQCSVNVTDSQAETITVQATERVVGGAQATENVTFRPGSVAPARLDRAGNNQALCIGPNDDTPNAPAPDSTRNNLGGNCNVGGTSGPTPGQPIQLTYTLLDTGAGNGSCAANGSDSASCTGGTLPFVSLNLSLSNSAFFTPNCQAPDTFVPTAPQRTTPGAAGPPAVASTGALTAPHYHNCTFTTAPADGVTTGSLKNLGNTLTVVTDQNGQFTITVAMERNADFDDDGFAASVLTAAAGGTNLTARESGTGTATGNNCPATSTGGPTGGNPAGIGAPSGAPSAGCNEPIVFRTRGVPLNGTTVSIVSVASGQFTNNGTVNNNGTLSDSQTNQIGNDQFRVFDIQMKDQYGNLVRIADPQCNFGCQNTDFWTALTKKGVGTLFACDNTQQPSASNPCPGATPVQETLDQGSTTSFTTTGVATPGSFTRPDLQDRFAIDAESHGGSFGCLTNPANNQFQSCSFDTGNTTITAAWSAPKTTFWFTAAAGPPPTTTFTGYHELSTAASDKVDITFYNPAPKNVTVTVSPGTSVRTGTVVNVTATITDQSGHPVPGALVTFTRSGPTTGNGSSCTANQQVNQQTNTAGKASFTFTCQNASTQTVNIQATDASGNPIGSPKNVAIHFNVPRTHISATINCTSPRKHHVKCKVHVSPRFAGLTVVFRNAAGHVVGIDTTNSHGNAFFRKGHLKSGKHHTYSAHVRHSSRTFGANAGSDGVTVK